MKPLLPSRPTDAARAARCAERGGVQFDVLGKPLPEGTQGYGVATGISKKTGLPYQYGYGYDAQKGLTQEGGWRDQIAWAGRLALRHRPPFDQPVALLVDFFMPRPRSAPHHAVYQATKPDDDKLLRGVGDGLSVNGDVIADDRLIVAHQGNQFYADWVPRNTPPAPTGARITIIPLGGHTPVVARFELHLDPAPGPHWIPPARKPQGIKP